MLHFDLKDLRVFSAVALTGSITKASEYIHLSPSATSDRLSDLENRAGTKLFRRSSRGLRLNPAGEVFAESAKKILFEAEALETRLAPFAHGEEKRITVCCNYNAGVTFLPRRLGRFLSHFEDVQVEVVQRSSPEIVRHVAAGEADVGVTAFSGMHPLLEFTPFATDWLVAVVPVDHPLAKRKEIAFSELFPYNYIAVGPYSPMQEFLYERAREEGAGVVCLTPDPLYGEMWHDFGTGKVRCYNIDASTMRTMLRAENGLVVLDDGTIMAKRNCRDIRP